jgi:hypothetical protein
MTYTIKSDRDHIDDFETLYGDIGRDFESHFLAQKALAELNNSGDWGDSRPKYWIEKSGVSNHPNRSKLTAAQRQARAMKKYLAEQEERWNPTGSRMSKSQENLAIKRLVSGR